MKLAKPFYRLPVLFDIERLREEVSAFPGSAWAPHPNEIAGNHSVRLISVDGGENDDVDGVMLATPHLAQSPYLRQVLASFGVVWSRSRLLKLEPFAGVPQHADINHHWFTRVRLHVPIITHPDVRFFCGDEQVHMAAGEAWIFDNWRLHRVENPVNAARIHLVADTSGSGSFWQFVAQGRSAKAAHQHRYDSSRDANPLTERTVLRSVMPAAEVDLLLADLQSELTALPDAASQSQLAAYRGLLDTLRRDWRQLYQLHGENPSGRAEYEKLRDSVRAASKEQAAGLTMRTNRVAAHSVLEGRLLRALLPAQRTPRGRVLRRPIFIVAAPRSGSTLLFETLAASDQLCSVGGEAHWLVESIPALRVGAPGVDSNRLDASHAGGEVPEKIIAQIIPRLEDSRGRPVAAESELRFLEKTPKNALRVPFFERIFPDAMFIFLWREPRGNLSSIIEAWRSGNWKTYNGLDGFDGPWSLLLPPGWAQYRGKSLGAIAAFQWAATNGLLMDDLEKLPRERWGVVNYADLAANPAATIAGLCRFAGIDFNASLSERTRAPLPLSRFTQSPPAADKWLRNEAAINEVLPGVAATWERLRTFGT